MKSYFCPIIITCIGQMRGFCSKYGGSILLKVDRYIFDLRLKKPLNRVTLLISYNLVFVLFILPPGHLWAEITNRIIAKVNGDIITLHELNASMKRLIGFNTEDLKLKDRENYNEVRRTVLDNLINEKITEQQIVRLGIEVTKNDVEEAIEKLKSENHLTQEELVHSLELEGFTFEEYKEKIKREIERFRLINYEVKSKIVITEDEVKEYYQKHKEEYAEACEVKLARFFLKVQNPNDKQEIARLKTLGDEILRSLKEGYSFSELAKTYSQGPAGPEGGDLGWIKLGHLEPTLREKITRLSPGDHTGLDFTTSGLQIIKLVDKKEGGVKPFEEVRDAIYSKLFKEKVEERYAQWLEELRKRSFIKVLF